MCCRHASDVLFVLGTHPRLRFVVAILDVHMSRLADIAHGYILTIRTECILAAHVWA